HEITMKRLKISGPILIVDDDPDEHLIVVDICKTIGISEHLKFFHSGPDLVEFLNTTSTQPFLILCDINMPGFNGMETRRSIDADPKLKRKSIPFVFFSTSVNAEQVTAAYDLTVQGFFLKGNTFSETRERLVRIFEYWCDCKHPNSRDLAI
ncbi:MAG TPA: response regulator, partial [Cyclobacteriaceae bacterium]